MPSGDKISLVLHLRVKDVIEPGPLTCDLETRIGPSGFFGATRTEPLSFVSATSNRACGDSTAENAMGSSGPSIDEPLAMYKAGAITYLDVDGLGSAIATNDPAGSVTSAAIFDAWGMQKVATPTILHPFSYTGRELGEAGLLFYRARSYQPGVGRFVLEDPSSRTYSNYLYVDNGATQWTDPEGLCKVQVQFSPLGKVPLVGPYYHAYIVASDPSGTTWYFRGGPSANGPSGGSSGATSSGGGGGSSNGSGSNSSNSTSPGSGRAGANKGPWGPIVGTMGPYGPGTIDYPRSGEAGRRPEPLTVLDDDKPCECMGCFTNALNDIESRGIAYNPFTTNSNTVVKELLSRCGLPSGAPRSWAPGWGGSLR